MSTVYGSVETRRMGVGVLCQSAKPNLNTCLVGATVAQVTLQAISYRRDFAKMWREREWSRKRRKERVECCLRRRTPLTASSSGLIFKNAKTAYLPNRRQRPAGSFRLSSRTSNPQLPLSPTFLSLLSSSTPARHYSQPILTPQRLVEAQAAASLSITSPDISLAGSVPYPFTSAKLIGTRSSRLLHPF